MHVKSLSQGLNVDLNSNSGPPLPLDQNANKVLSGVPCGAVGADTAGPGGKEDFPLLLS